MRHLVAVALVVLAAAVLAPMALADGNGKVTLGPAGYKGPGSNASLVVAGSANVALGDGDHVVICHAIGGPKGSAFIQIAPSASGVVNGHGDHEGDRDIIPPFTFQSKKGSDTTLAAGKNWNAANAAVYANGCSAPAATPPVTPPPPPPPTDACPNIEGVQTSIPAGMTKDASGNCTVLAQSPPPATTTTVTVEKVIVNTVVVKKVVIQKKVVKAKAKKHVKKLKKVKKVKHVKAKIRVKAAHKVFKPRVLPHTR